MKVFNRKHYEFLGVEMCNADSKLYFAFRCIKDHFSPEVVLVSEAKLLYSDWGYVFFNESYIDASSLSLKADSDCQKSLIYNERKWRSSRDSLRGNVNSRKTSRG